MQLVRTQNGNWRESRSDVRAGVGGTVRGPACHEGHTISSAAHRSGCGTEEDLARLATLTSALMEVDASRFVLISTIDVYPHPSCVDEGSVIDVSAAQPYGRNRLALEGVMRTMLARHGVTGVELAPLVYWPTAPDVAPSVLAAYRARWADVGISVVALQGVLFERPRLQLFGSAEQRRALTEHLVGIVRLAAGAGAQTVVFGASTNRLRGVL